jgi:tetratricopeptide (TPR) repeat protein
VVPAARGAAPSRLIRALSLALLGLAVLAAFGGVLRNGWMLLDDPGYVYENPHVSPGLTVEGLRWFLHQPHGGNWHPLTSLSHMLDVQLFGLTPAGHHAVSLALHLLNVLLLVIVLHRFTGAWWRSLLVGALFGLHPLRVESVAWVAERKDVLSGLFFLLTLEAWRRWAARPGVRRYALVVACLALGLMSKPMLVTLPFVLVLLDVWPLGRLRGVAPPDGASGCRAPRRTLAGLLVEKWPLFALAAVSVTVTLVIQKQSGAVMPAALLGLPERVGNALLSYWRYIGMTFWPGALSPFYPLPAAVNPWAAVAAAAGLAAVTALALRRGRERPYLAVGWSWYLGTLVPVLGLVQVGMQGHADRYTYVPIIGLLIAAVWGAGDLLVVRRRAQGVAAAGAVLALAALGVTTARQVALWKDTRTLFTHARRVTGESVVVEQVLGSAFEADSQRAEAIRHLRRAVELDSNYVRSRYNLGLVLARDGRIDEAVRQFRRALDLQPMNSEVLINLGLAVQRQGGLDEAETLYRRAALNMGDNQAWALRQLGVVVALQGRVEEGLGLMRQATALAPDGPDSHVLFASALLAFPGHDAEAAEHLRLALRRAPVSVEALNGLAWLLATSPDPAVRQAGEAMQLAERAVQASGGRDPGVLDTQAAAQAGAGRMDTAIATARRALELAVRASADTLAVAIRGRIASYEQGRAWVDSARVAGTLPGQLDRAGGRSVARRPLETR